MSPAAPIAHAFDAIATSEARYRTLAETASDAILTIDPASTITYANPATEELFGYPGPELEGEPLTKLMPDRFEDRHRAGIRWYLRSGQRRFEWTGVELPGERADGTELPLSISFGEYEHDGEQFFTVIIRDVSDRAGSRPSVAVRSVTGGRCGRPGAPPRGGTPTRPSAR